MHFLNGQWTILDVASLSVATKTYELIARRDFFGLD
jgi:hypothetical protein